MKKKFLIVAICLIVCGVCLYKYFEPNIEIKKAQDEYNDIVDTVIKNKQPSVTGNETVIEEENEETDDSDDSKYDTGSYDASWEVHEYLDIDFDALLEINDDCIGWIYIPNMTQFSYPICKSADNHDYLVTSFKKTANEVGVPFVDYLCATDFSDFNTLIYGHYTVTHYMFGELYDYMSGTKHNHYPLIQIYTPDNKVRIYQVFSAEEIYVDGSPIFTVGNFSMSQRQNLINTALQGSRFNFYVTPNPENNILNLVCCTEAVDKERRLVISATLIDTVELN